MLKDVRYVVRENLEALDAEEKEIEEKIDALENEVKKLQASRKNFNDFYQKEALVDEDVENLAVYGKYKPNAVNAFKDKYIKSIEKDELDCILQIEKLEKKLNHLREHVKEYNTREKLTEAANHPKSIKNSCPNAERPIRTR